jgi:hypothetical protein
MKRISRRQVLQEAGLGFGAVALHGLMSQSRALGATVEGARAYDLRPKQPHFTKVVDDVTFVRSMTTDRIDHSTAQFTFVTGRGFTGFPSIGSWVSYALGTENQNLPAFMVLEAGPSTINTRAYSSAWLPPIYSGTKMQSDPEAPIFDIKRPDGMSPEQQRQVLDLVGALNRKHKKQYPLDQDLEARIANYELAARMQMEAMKVADLSNESEATKQLYGIDDRVAGPFSRNCLLARRLVERGVRFVELTIVPPPGTGGGNSWDQHGKLREHHAANAMHVDQPIAALVKDLKARGMLDRTLVIWSGEFGRAPFVQGTDGRDHNPYGFSLWLAGGGIRGGMTFGETDEYGYRAVENVLTIHDLHATVLHMLGIDHERLTFRFGGRDFRLTDVHGQVIRPILKA